MPVNQTASGVSFDLIRSARNGDRAAFSELAVQCRRRVMGTINCMIARPEDVEDVAQEVFIRMHRSIPHLKDHEAFELWSYRLTTNATYDYLRKRPRRREVRMSDLSERQVDAATDIASRQSARDEHERARTIDYVDGLLARLSPSDRILLVMREVEGLSLAELAAVLGINVGAVKLRLFRARNRLRRILQPNPTVPVDGVALGFGQTPLPDVTEVKKCVEYCKHALA
jgi:RNA polymerase sigma-70 factor (ECF subfamily)